MATQHPVDLSSLAEDRAQPSGIDRRLLMAVATLTTAVLIVFGQPLLLALLCLSTIVIVASALAPDAVPGGAGVIREIPTAFLIVVCWAIVWGLVGSVTGLRTLGTQPGALLGVFALVATAGLVGKRRGGRVLLVGHSKVAVAGFVTLLGFFSWVMVSQPFAWWSRINATGTDFLRHLGLIRDLREQGVLDLGAITYPKAFHAPVAWLISAADLPVDARSLWQAAAPVALLLVSMILLVVMVVAQESTAWIARPTWAGSCAAVTAGVVFVQTAWLDTFLALGSVMNLITALALLVILAEAMRSSELSAVHIAISAGSAVAVLANAYPLVLPIAAVGVLPLVLRFLWQQWRHLGAWAIWIGCAALTFYGFGVRIGRPGYTQASVTEAVSAPAVSMLDRPEWWWWVGVVLAFVAAVMSFRKDRRVWASSLAGMLVAMIAVTVLLMRGSDSSWEFLKYYPAKTLWTALVIVIPSGVAGLLALTTTVWRSGTPRSPLMASLARGSSVLLVCVVGIGVLGRASAFPPHVWGIAEGNAGPPNWSLAVIEELRETGLPSTRNGGALVFGLMPSATESVVASGYPGVVDFMATEALTHLGWREVAGDPVKVSLATGDLPGVCDFLRLHPDAMRVTGPNPQSGPIRLLESGCPTSVVRPERWISLRFAPEWLARSQWEDPATWTYPTVAEVAAVMARPAR